MKFGFYRKIAWNNVKKNYRFFIPRILAEIGLLGCFYIAVTLAGDKRMENLKGGAYLPTFMVIGVAVLAILSTVLMFYTNSFLMKQRKREFGLYTVLGMEKKHVGRVLLHESLIGSLISVAGGLGLGMLFYKLCSLLICRLLSAEIVLGFYFIHFESLALSGAGFLILDAIIYVINRFSIARMKPVELLQSRAAGEREPRVKWVMLVVGVLSLGGGYYIAITTQNPLSVLGLFFVAVVLVILGTYFLFVTGSTFVLKALRRNERCYYNKRRMPAISGLLYRMKQNAVGLASIAILATGVLVMTSTTVSLYSGLEGTLEKNYPNQLYLSASYLDEEERPVSVPAEKLEEFVQAAAEKNGLKITRTEKNEYLLTSYYYDGTSLLAQNEAEDAGSGLGVLNGIMNFAFISEDTYTLLTGNVLKLEGNEVAICRISTGAAGPTLQSEEFTLHGTRYEVRSYLNSFPIKLSNVVISSFNTYGVVLSSEDALAELYEKHRDVLGIHASDLTERLAVSFSDPQKASDVGEQLNRDIQETLWAYEEERSASGEYGWTYDTLWGARESLVGMYGALLFLGILLGTVCLFATVLIIYFKQISEGYEDRERFAIMEKIGMSAEEVRRTINTQVRLVFFLPLITAGIHIAFAYPMLHRMLEILMLYKATLFLECTLITFAVFAAVYVIIYRATSRTYYKIVH